MPDVILLDPISGSGKNQRPQLGTLNLAAMLLQNSISVEIIDFSVQDDGERLLKKYLESDVICVGISTVIGPMLASGLDLAQLVRKQRPDIPIIWGGIHPTLVPEGTLKHKLVDAICIGDGEITFVKMVEALRYGRKLHDIPGIGFKEKGNLIFTPPEKELFDLNLLPPLPYHLVDINLFRIRNKTRYNFFGLKGDLIVSLETSRGCPFICSYCVNAAKREKYRKMRPGKVIQSLQDIVNLGVRSIAITDDNFFADKKWAAEVLKSIANKDLGLEMYISARSDYLGSIDDSDFELMKNAGVSMFTIGTESGSNKTLKRINKKETIEHSFAANRRLAKYGMYAWFHFIYGFPGERKEDFLESYNAMHRILEENPLYAMVNLNRLIPNPGTPSFYECVAGGWTSPDTIEGWAEVIESTRSKTPAYMDPDLAKWIKLLNGVPFPADTLPSLKQLKLKELKELIREIPVLGYLAKELVRQGRRTISLITERKNSAFSKSE